MYKQITVKKNLNTEIAKEIVQNASGYGQEVSILYDNKKVNAKSIMGVLSLALKKGETAFVEAKGEEAEHIIDKIIKLI
jgi:phosphotransferase system HPr (HPr) family protein